MTRKKDKSAKREADKYPKPIASREYLLQHFHDAQGPLAFKQLVRLLGYDDDALQIALQRRLRAMIRDGQLFCNRKHEYVVVEQADLIPGAVIAHADGFGFVTPDAGGNDLFLAPRQMATLLHGDRVLVRESRRDRRGRRAGTLVEILQRAFQEIAGRYHRQGQLGFVTPQNRHLHQDILVPPGEQGDAENGDFVVVDIVAYPTESTHAIGRVRQILGGDLRLAVQIEVTIRNFVLPHIWSDAVNGEISRLGKRPSASQMSGRLDVRHLPFVTIDGDDAQDFDDAVYCEPTSKGWRLRVAIADVATYVQSGSALDAEAYERSVSVYFPRRVVPMLPEVLSNGLCSIKPAEDRLCLLCEMRIDHSGQLGQVRFYEAVMRSAARLTYTQVAAILVDEAPSLMQQYRQLLPHLRQLYALYQALAKARRRRGALDFETVETHFEFDADGGVKSVGSTTRNVAHRLVEECMISANIAAARWLQKHKMPALFRIHDAPTAEKLEALRAFLAGNGLSLGGGDAPTSKHYADVLRANQGANAGALQSVLLRSLQQAVYHPENKGHFGLGLAQYVHFTSPIRRYPDLLAHRAIRHVLRGGKAAQYEYSRDDMQKYARQCSRHERRAEEAGWEVDEALKCAYLRARVGDEFDGVISGVSGAGLFVDLCGVNIAGLVHVTLLGHDYFHRDALHHRLTGEHTGVVFALGQNMRVRVTRVDVGERKINLAPVKLPPPLRRRGKSKSNG